MHFMHDLQGMCAEKYTPHKGHTMNKSKHVLIAFALLAFASTSFAKSDEEYVKDVGKELRTAAFADAIAGGSISAVVKVTHEGAVLKAKSGLPAFDEEVLRAANAALDSSIQAGLTFPVRFQGARLVNFNTSLPSGAF